MRSDIRIVENDETDMVQVSRVFYDEKGEVLTTDTISEHVTIEGAYEFLDDCYKATLKASLIQLKDGSYD